MLAKPFFKKANRINKTLSIIAAFISFFVVGSVLYAATTIGNNINTGGTLDVTGLSTFSRATSTSATTTDYLYVGSDFTAPPGIDYKGDLLVFDDLFVNSQATSSASLWVGSGGTADNINTAGGDLYVQNDAEIDGALYLNVATSTSATTTDYLYVGSDFTAPPGIDYKGDLLVFDDLFVNSQATSSASLWVGSGGTADIINTAGGDLYVQDDVEIDGSLFVGQTSSTTAKIVLGARHTADATSTLILGDEAAESATCIKLRTTAGDWVYSYATSSGSTIAQGLTWTSTSCE